jgi:hypothetical protein
MLRALVPLLAITILMVAPAEATTTYYTGSTGEASFNTAVSGLTLLDPALTFSGTPGSTGLLNASGTGIDFLGFDGFPGNPLSFTVPSGNLTATASGEVVEINLPAAGIYALGIHIAETSGTGNWCIDLTPTKSCAYTVFSTGSSDAEFFGLVSNTPVSASLYINFTGGNPKIVLTNFEAFGAASDPVPEPRTILLVGLGLVILPLTRRKKRV